MEQQHLRMTPGAAADDTLWRAVAERDPRYDGLLVFGVRTTGVYCRPACPSRRPRRENVAFFAHPQAAEAAGYRACRRCRPGDAKRGDATHDAVAAACRILAAQDRTAVRIGSVARRIGFSERRLRELFDAALGVSPSAYAEALRVARFRAALKSGPSVTEALYDAGYESPSRAYEKATRRLGMTPAEYRRGGVGQAIGYEIIATPLGRMLVAGTARGVCRVAFGSDGESLRAALAREFPRARMEPGGNRLRAWTQALARFLGERRNWPRLPMDVYATAFQARVWRALREIPPGKTATYSEIARRIGAPRATRAVGSACGANPVAVVVPCHRAVRADGGLGGYAWGLRRKSALLALESKETTAGRKPGARK